MPGLLIVCACLFSTFSVSIVEPADGGTYNGDWLDLKAIVTNDNSIPDSVSYTLNGKNFANLPRLNTDWYTYMANDLHTGFSQSPAPLEGTLFWAADSITGPMHEFCSPVVVDGVVYHVSDQQSTVFALDAVTGDVLWTYDVVDNVDDAVTWYNGMVFVAADSAFCLDAVTGERVWSFKPSTSDFKMNGTPALGDGVAYFSYAPDWDSMEIYALDAFTGDVLWCTLLPDYSTGCVTLCDGRLVVPTYGGSLFALDVTTGEVLWENSSSASGYWDSSPVVVEDFVYICDFDGNARAVSFDTGETVWVHQVSTWYIAATPAFAYGHLFFGDQVDSFRCLEGLNGSLVWSVSGVQHGSPGIADGTVFFGEGADGKEMGEIRALSVETGDEVWSYATGGSEIYSSPAITDGIVYIAGMDWKLYAMGTELQYSYLDSFLAATGENELIVTSWFSGESAAADTVVFTVTGSGMEFGPSIQLRLAASPNPSTSAVSISFELNEPVMTSLVIYDLSGREVVSVLNSELSSGVHSVQWNGINADGEAVPPGLYLCHIIAGSTSESTGMCLLDR